MAGMSKKKTTRIYYRLKHFTEEKNKTSSLLTPTMEYALLIAGMQNYAHSVSHISYDRASHCYAHDKRSMTPTKQKEKCISFADKDIDSILL